MDFLIARTSMALGLLVPVAIIAAVVYGIMKLVRRPREFADMDLGIGTVRRLYFYVVTLVALVIGASGVVFIATFVVESIFIGGDVSTSTTRQAIGLSMTIVGLPLWWFHWRLIVRHVAEMPVETRSVVRKLYIYVVLAISGGLVMQGAIVALGFMFRTSDFYGRPWAAMIVWGGVWAFHWRLESLEGQHTPETRALRRIYIYGVAGFTLVMAAAGFGQIVHLVLREAYDALVSPPTVASSSLSDEQTRRALILLVVGGAVWAGHWVYLSRDDEDSVLRQLYVYVLAQFVPFVAVFVASGLALNETLVWAIGVPEDTISVHFRFIPDALTVMIVAGSALAYHRFVADRKAHGPSAEAQHAYPYALAGVGLLALTLAISMLVNTVIEFALERDAAVSANELLRNSIAHVLSIGVLGAPLWWYYWNGVQRRLETDGLEERSGRPRRIYLTAAQGVGMIALLSSVSFVVFVFFRWVLEADLTDFVQDARVGLAIMVPVAIFLPYHWLVYREDRRVIGEVAPEDLPRERKSVTVFVSRDAWGFVEQLEKALGYAVTPLEWTDPDARAPEISNGELAELVRRIGDAAGHNVLLVPDGGAVRVLSYE